MLLDNIRLGICKLLHAMCANKCNSMHHVEIISRAAASPVWHLAVEHFDHGHASCSGGEVLTASWRIEPTHHADCPFWICCMWFDVQQQQAQFGEFCFRISCCNVLPIQLEGWQLTINWHALIWIIMKSVLLHVFDQLSCFSWLLLVSIIPEESGA